MQKQEGEAEEAARYHVSLIEEGVDSSLRMSSDDAIEPFEEEPTSVTSPAGTCTTSPEFNDRRGRTSVQTEDADGTEPVKRSSEGNMFCSCEGSCLEAQSFR